MDMAHALLPVFSYVTVRNYTRLPHEIYEYLTHNPVGCAKRYPTGALPTLTFPYLPVTSLIFP